MDFVTRRKETRPSDKEDVQCERISISNGIGLGIEICNLGATVMSVKYHQVEVTSAVNNLPCPAYSGATCGRVANRIAGAAFELNGVNYKLKPNQNENLLHGGTDGFHAKVWQVERVIDDANHAGIELVYHSPDGEEGFPGSVVVSAKYLLSKATNQFAYVYSCELEENETKETIVNVVNHTYWNLSGKKGEHIGKHHLQVNCSSYIPVDIDCIPHNEIASVENSVFDLRKSPITLETVLGNVGNEHGEHHGYDHCFCIDTNEYGLTTIDEHPFDMNIAAILTCNDIRMTIATTQPGCQIYTGNWLPSKHTAIAFETQHYPDSIHQSKFPSIILKPGEKLQHATVHDFETF